MQVLSQPDHAWLRWSDENRYTHGGMVAGNSLTYTNCLHFAEKGVNNWHQVVNAKEKIILYINLSVAMGRGQFLLLLKAMMMKLHVVGYFSKRKHFV